MSVKDFQIRWDDIALSFFKEFKPKILSTKNKLINSPFGLTEDGKQDYRGFQLEGQQIRKIIFEEADFSYSNFSRSSFEKCEFNKVVFSKADFTEFSERGNVFFDSEFTKCKIIKAGIGYLGTKYIDVAFNNCNFQGAVFIRPEYDRCFFENCKLNGIDFNASSFVDCQFQGILKEVWFRGNFASQEESKQFGQSRVNEMINVSFKLAELQDVTFSDGCDLSTVILPEDSTYLYCDNWESRLMKLKNGITKLSKETAFEVQIFCDSYLVHADNQHQYILNSEDVKREYGEVAALHIITTLSN